MPENKDICAKCKGECCKCMSGIYAPDDFNEISVESLLECFSHGQLSIDWWEGDIRDGFDEFSVTYFLRPRHKLADVIDPSWGGECTFLTDMGCSLVYSNRPQNCRDLIAHADNSKCNLGDMTKKDYIKMWVPYQQILTDCYIESFA